MRIKERMAALAAGIQKKKTGWSIWQRSAEKKFFSIPNLMGYFRILMIPVFSWMYLTASTREDVYRAAAVVFISSVTDLLDGWVARRFHMVTELGKFVDPLADKLTHGALALCLAFKYPLMWALAALLAVKEGYMAVMGLILLKRGKEAGRRNVVRKGLYGPCCLWECWYCSCGTECRRPLQTV